jgi:hypothetical protein
VWEVTKKSAEHDGKYIKLVLAKLEETAKGEEF